jgi:hypothetical protein
VLSWGGVRLESGLGIVAPSCRLKFR